MAFTHILRDARCIRDLGIIQRDDEIFGHCLVAQAAVKFRHVDINGIGFHLCADVADTARQNIVGHLHAVVIRQVIKDGFADALLIGATVGRVAHRFLGNRRDRSDAECSRDQ